MSVSRFADGRLIFKKKQKFLKRKNFVVNLIDKFFNSIREYTVYSVLIINN